MGWLCFQNMNALAEPIATTLRCTEPLPTRRHREIVRHMMLDGGKWDAQVGDVAVLAPFALVLPRQVWVMLAAEAEELTRELFVLEQALLHRPALWPRLGVPARVRRALEKEQPWTPSAARVMRFDFHPTTDGWRISEVNSDVPGGFNEASTFTALVAEDFPGFRPAGDPLGALADALAAQARHLPRMALLAAPGHPADLQVVHGLATALRQRGVEAIPARPEQLSWSDGRAYLASGSERQPIGVIYRFFNAEWLARIAGDGWHPLFRGGLTPVCNPAAAVLSESKRLPLLWAELGMPVPTWSRLLPVNRPARTAAGSGNWLLKGAYSNNGESVLGRGWRSRPGFGGAMLHAMIRPGSWVAQRRFDSLALPTPEGPMHPCLGVYTVEGRTTGIYARLSPQPMIDYLARDVAVLVED